MAVLYSTFETEVEPPTASISTAESSQQDGAFEMSSATALPTAATMAFPESLVAVLMPVQVVAVSGAEQQDARARGETERTIRVEDKGHQPVAGARVEVWATPEQAGAAPYSFERVSIWNGQGQDPRPVAEPAKFTVVTDEQGLCSVPLPSRSAVFLASRDGVGTSGLWYAKALEDQPDATMSVPLFPLAELHGRVVRSDDSSAGGATIRFAESLGVFKTWIDGSSGRGDARRPADVSAETDGTFVVMVDHEFMGRAQAFLDGQESSVETATWGGTATYPLTLRFSGRYSIEGVVRGPDDEPLAGVKVSASHRLSNIVEVESKDDGSYSLQLFAPGRYAIAAGVPFAHERADLVMSIPFETTLTPSHPAVVQDIDFIEGVSITGTAHWTDGSPVESVSFLAEPVERADRPLAPVQRLALQVMKMRPFKGEPPVTAGHFVISRLHPDFAYDLECVLDRQAGMIVSKQGVAPGTDDVEFVFDRAWEAGITIAGQVLDARSGAPLEQFTPTLSYEWKPSRSGPQPLPTGRAASLEAAGRFHFAGVPRGLDYYVRVSAPGYAGEDLGPIDADHPPGVLRIALTRAGSLAIRVVSPDGAAVSDAAVACLLPDTTPVRIQHFLRIRREALSNDGSLTLDGLRRGDHWLQAFTIDACSEVQRITVPAVDSTVTLRLEPDRTQANLSVHVTDRFGAPVIGTEVWASGQAPGKSDRPGFTASPRWTSSTGNDGIARFEALPSGLIEVGCNDLDVGIAMPEVLVLATGTSPSIELVLE